MAEQAPSRLPFSLGVAGVGLIGGVGLVGLAAFWGYASVGGRDFRILEAGFYGPLLVVAGLGTVLLAAVLSGLAVHYPRFPLAVAALPAVGLPLLAAAGVGHGHLRVLGAIGGESVAVEQKLRILAEGAGEVHSGIVLGAAMFLAALLPVAVGGSGKALAEARGVGFGRAAVALLATSIVVGILALVARLLLVGTHGMTVELPIAMFAFLLLLIGALALDRRELDATTRARAAMDVAVTAAAILAAIFTVGVLTRASGARAVLQALAGESIDPSQRARILLESVQRLHRALPASAIDLMPLALAGLLVVVLGARRSAPLALGVGVLVAGLLSTAVAVPGAVGYFVERETLALWVKETPRRDLVALPPSTLAPPCPGPARFALSKTTLTGPNGLVRPVEALDQVAGCREVASVAVAAEADYGSGARDIIAVDSGVPYSRVACLFEALAERRGSDETGVDWQIQPPIPQTLPPPPFDVLSQLPLCLATRTPTPERAGGPDTARTPRVHVAQAQWVFFPGRMGGPPKTLGGSPTERVEALRSALREATPVAVSAEPGTPIDEVLVAVAVLAREHTVTPYTRLAPPSTAPVGLAASIRASHILIAYQGAERVAPSVTRSKEEAESLAHRVLSRVRGGEDFTQVAKEVSDCPSRTRGGDLGRFGPHMMAPTFEAAAFALEVGALSTVVETPFGFHLIRRTE